MHKIHIQTASLSLYTFQQKMFWVLSACIVLVAAAYLYIVCQTILNIVERRTAEASIVNINSNISDLESQYIALGQSINASFAASSGFHDISTIEYVSRSPVLTMRDPYVR